MYTQTSRQGQSRQRQSWQRGTAATAALRLPVGEYALQHLANGLWGFEAEGTAYRIKHRHAGSTKPVLYLMAELKPKPAYVSSLYFLSWHSGSVSMGEQSLSMEMQSAMAWQYAAQLPADGEPVLYVSVFSVAPVGSMNGREFIEVSHSEDSCSEYWRGSSDYESQNSRAFFLPF